MNFDWIRKDYPTTGVLKLRTRCTCSSTRSDIRKDYPTTGVLKLFKWWGVHDSPTHQEGLPDYWGIETSKSNTPRTARIFPNQEGLPDYWGIETHYNPSAGLTDEC